MAHCTCIYGHSMWDGNTKYIYLPYRFNFFRQFTTDHPSFVLSKSDFTEIYDCYDTIGNEHEEYDCWYCDKCKSLTLFNNDSTNRYDFIITKDVDNSKLNLSKWEKFAVISEKNFPIFQNYYKGLTPFNALNSYSFNLYAYLNSDKDTVIVKNTKEKSTLTYRLYKKHVY